MKNDPMLLPELNSKLVQMKSLSQLELINLQLPEVVYEDFF
jgi:hypothetical protein